MKFYIVMVCLLAVDMIFFAVLAKFYMPSRDTAAFIIMKYFFFVPIIVVCILQLVKLCLNVKHGYVVTLGVFKIKRYDISRNIFELFEFLIGVVFEVIIWSLMFISVLKFLTQ